MLLRLCLFGEIEAARVLYLPRYFFCEGFGWRGERGRLGSKHAVVPSLKNPPMRRLNLTIKKVMILKGGMYLFLFYFTFKKRGRSFKKCLRKHRYTEYSSNFLGRK